ncbi:RloB family protein [Myxococcota bacterium]|nr:RloB family protein [Myxococcota bacterium]
MRRVARRTTLVVTEDAKSSQSYLWALARSLRLSAVDIQGPKQTNHTDPDGIVAWAIERRGPRRSPAFDDVWVVFDRDEGQHDIAQAVARARDVGLHIAFSNPAWEIWLVAHFDASTRPRHRDEALKVAMQHLPNFTKATSAFNESWPKVDDAIRVAKAWRKHHAVTGGTGNPSTSFDRLVRFLRGDADWDQD